jgi:hypothetical protein
MIKISKQAKCVLDQLTESLNKPGHHRKIDQTPGFMAVHVEHIGQCDLGPMFSVAQIEAGRGAAELVLSETSQRKRQPT